MISQVPLNDMTDGQPTPFPDGQPFTPSGTSSGHPAPGMQNVTNMEFQQPPVACPNSQLSPSAVTTSDQPSPPNDQPAPVSASHGQPSPPPANSNDHPSLSAATPNDKPSFSNVTCYDGQPPHPLVLSGGQSLPFGEFGVPNLLPPGAGQHPQYFHYIELKVMINNLSSIKLNLYIFCS